MPAAIEQASAGLRLAYCGLARRRRFHRRMV